MFFVRGSKLTLYLCASRKLLVFRVSMEIDLVFVTVELDLISVWGKIYLVVVWVVEIDLLLGCWTKITRFLDEHQTCLRF